MKVLSVLILTLLSSSVFSKPPAALGADQTYKWEKVKEGQQSSTFPATGMIIADEGALHIQSARVNGRVLSLMSEEGGIVKKGSPLFLITGPECISIREEKRIAINSKLEDLVSSIVARERELNIKVTEKECVSLADASGVLVKRNVISGNSFSQGDVLAQILEPERMRVEIEVPERSASAIVLGTKVKFRMPSAPDFVGESVIKQVFPIVEEGSRMMKARLHRAPLPQKTKLNSMVFADIELMLNKLCIIIPITAVTFQDNHSWVVKKHTSLEMVSVEVVGKTENGLLVRSLTDKGLKDGDTIATHNVPFLYREMKQQINTKR